MLKLLQLKMPLPRFQLTVDLVCAEKVTGIFGPSGAGKTSLLDVVAGLRKPASGRIELNGRLLLDAEAGFHLPPRKRRIGYLPQDLALFPHLSVEENIRFGQARSSSQLFSWDHVVEVLEIAPLLREHPQDLSGGEQQRVALARALVSSPDLLLLDEPLASLDRQLKSRLIPFLQRIGPEFDVPMLYVSHDEEELRQLVSEIILLQQGTVTGRRHPADLPP